MSIYFLFLAFPFLCWSILQIITVNQQRFRWVSYSLYILNFIVQFEVGLLTNSGAARFGFFGLAPLNTAVVSFHFAPIDFAMLASITVIHLVFISFQREDLDFRILAGYGLLIVGFTNLMVGFIDWRLSGVVFILIAAILIDMLSKIQFPALSKYRLLITLLLSGFIALLILFMASSNPPNSGQASNSQVILNSILIVLFFLLFPAHFWITSYRHRPLIFGYLYLLVTTFGLFWVFRYDPVFVFQPGNALSENIFQIIIGINMLYAGILGIFGKNWDDLIFGLIIYDSVRIVILGTDWDFDYRTLDFIIYRIIFIGLLLLVYDRLKDDSDSLPLPGEEQAAISSTMAKYLICLALIGYPFSPGFGSLIELMSRISAFPYLIVISIIGILGLTVGVARRFYSEYREDHSSKDVALGLIGLISLLIYFAWGFYHLIRVMIL